MFEYIWTPEVEAEVEAEVETALQLSLKTKTKILHVSNNMLLLKTNAF